MDKATYDKLSTMGYREIFRLCREDPDLESGSPDVQFLLALCVRDGRGIRKDEKTFQKVLEWCLQKGSLLAIGYQEGYETGRREALLEVGNKAPLSEDGGTAAKTGQSVSESGEDRKEEKPVTVLFLTRPSKKTESLGADGSSQKAAESGRTNTASFSSRASSVLDQLYFAEDNEVFGRALSQDFSRIHQVLASDSEEKIRDFWESGEFDGFLARMPEADRGEVLADLIIKLNHYQKNNRPELVDICRKMALRILEGKVYISDLQLATKNEAGEKENFPVLWFAVWLGDMILAKYLLRSGANPNLVRRCRLADGVTLSRYALGECILQGNQPMARLLIENGANVRKMDGRKGLDGNESQTSFLAYAVLRNSPESVLLLLEKGMNPNEGYHFRDKEGKWHHQSALYLAVQHTKNLDIARILLEGGANPDSAGPLANVRGEMLRVLLKDGNQDRT